MAFSVHKAILASGSKYFQDVFAQFPKIKEVIAPLPYNQKEEGSSDDQVSRILKYLYNNQVSAFGIESCRILK